MAGERILIVEDERAVVRGLEYGLATEGFSVSLLCFCYPNGILPIWVAKMKG